MKIALTHIVSPKINQCEISYIKRRQINVKLAIKQHEIYCNLLGEHGLKVIELTMNRSFPDSTFIEDTAIVVDELAIMANMGAESRRGEVFNVEMKLQKYREIAHIQRPATLEGGDVLQMGKKIFVGLSPRTNINGIKSLQELLKTHGYAVIPVKLKDCLHFKSAVTAIDEQTLLTNPRWIDLNPFKDFKTFFVPEDEPWAANVLRLGNNIIMHDGYLKTLELLRKNNYRVKTCDISELIKAEAAMTCSSIIFRHPL